jgi:GT2 family glycosyltransferase
MSHIGLLWDSVSDNMGDKAIGLLLQRALDAHQIPHRTVDPFAPDVQDIAMLIVGGGELIRTPGHYFYDAFRVPGPHVLNTVGVLDGSDTDYLEGYRLVTARSKADCEKLGRGEPVPCLSLLYERYLPSGELPVHIPEGAIGIHLSDSFHEEFLSFVRWLREEKIGPIVWLPITHYNHDYSILKLLAEQVPDSILLPRMSPDNVFRAIGQLRALITSSLHGTLFAYVQNVPFIARRHPDKITYFLFERDLRHLTFKTAADIAEKLPRLLDHRPDFSQQTEADLSSCAALLEEIVEHAQSALASGSGSALRIDIPSTNRMAYDTEMAHYKHYGELTASLLRQQFNLEEEYRELLEESRRQRMIAETHLAQMSSTVSWQIVQSWWRFRQRLMPPGSSQDRLYRQTRHRLSRTLSRFLSGLTASMNQPLTPPASKKQEEQRYREFQRQFEPGADDLSKQRIEVSQWEEKPLFSIVTAVYNPPLSVFEEAVQSVQAQTYDNWEWRIADASSEGAIWAYLSELAEQDARIKPVRLSENRGISANTNAVLREAAGDYIVLLDHDDTIAAHALYAVAKTIQQHPDADFVFSDSDKLNEKGERCEPLFKPDWSPELLLSANLLTQLSVFRRSLLDEIGCLNPEMDGAQDWDLFLRISEHTRNIYHVPEILYHWRKSAKSTAQSTDNKAWVREAQRSALVAHLERSGLVDPVVSFLPEHPIHSVHPVSTWRLSNKPRVSIVIPSRDQADILSRCLESLDELTSYPDYEIILVDTGSAERDTYALYERWTAKPHFKLIHFREPFNFSKACNFGAAHATGQLLLFLNNDIEVLHDDWLHLMVQWFEREGVGVVGPKLLYPSGKIQHAGVIVGLGAMAAHIFSGSSEHISTIFGGADWYRNFLAVTGACMLISQEAFEAVGGFDEEFILNYSDIDLCLRVHEAGYRIVYTPQARLIHHEGTTHRGKIPRSDFEQGDKKWQRWFRSGDPYFNPNLSYQSTWPLFRRTIYDTSLNEHLKLMEILPDKKIITLPDDLS